MWRKFSGTPWNVPDLSAGREERSSSPQGYVSRRGSGLGVSVPWQVTFFHISLEDDNSLRRMTPLDRNRPGIPCLGNPDGTKAPPDNSHRDVHGCAQEISIYRNRRRLHWACGLRLAVPDPEHNLCPRSSTWGDVPMTQHLPHVPPTWFHAQHCCTWQPGTFSMVPGTHKCLASLHTAVSGLILLLTVSCGPYSKSSQRETHDLGVDKAFTGH